MASIIRTAVWPDMPRRQWILVGVILALALVLRGALLGQPPAGFLAFNEGFYIDLAARMAHQPAFAWFLHPLDVNNPPLFPVLVSWLYRLGAPQVAGARIISVLAGTWSVFVTFLLGRLLYDDRTGIIAAAVLAVTPGAVLVDHNIQVDPLFVALLLTGLYLYVLAARTGSSTSALLGGAVVGLSILTKQAAIIVLPALALWETWCGHDLRWLKKGRVWRFVSALAVVGVPWYLAQVYTSNIGPMLSNAGRATGAATLVGGAWFWRFQFFSEVVWMLFPLTALLAAGGLVYAGWRRQAGDKLVLVLTAAFLAWYLAFHLHSYYLLPLAPVLALAVGRLCGGLLADRIPGHRMRLVLVSALLVVMMFASVLMLGGQKWGRWSPMTFRPRADVGFSGVRLYYDPEITGVYGPAMDHMPPGLAASPLPSQDFPNTPTTAGIENLLLSGVLGDAAGNSVPPLKPVTDLWLRPVFFGYAIGQTSLNDLTRVTDAQFFTNAAWTVERIGPWWRFGMQATTIDSGLYLYNKSSF